MTGFANVIHGIKNFFHETTGHALELLSPVVNHLKDHAIQDLKDVAQGVIADVVKAQAEGKTGKDLLHIAIDSAEKNAIEQGKDLGTAALSSIASVAVTQALHAQPVDPAKLNE